MKLESLKTPIVSTVLLIAGYVIAVLLLLQFGFLPGENLLLIVTYALGWLIALLIAIIHLNRARKDNQMATKYEIRKKLEIEAYKEVNKAINDFSDTVTGISTLFFYTLPSKLKLHIQNPEIFKFDRIQIDQEIGLKRVSLYRGNSKFLLTIEANEISVIEYDFYRKYINFKTGDLYKLIDDFILYFSKVKTEELKKTQGYNEFKKRCNQINELTHDITSYLFDYRIILMNSILEEIFDKSVPRRKPLDPKYKLLTEVAIKEEVEKEEKRRSIAAIKGTKNTKNKQF